MANKVGKHAPSYTPKPGTTKSADHLKRIKDAVKQDKRR